MTDSPTALRICLVARDVSVRGAGLSMHDALAAIHYTSLRPSIGVADLVPVLQANAELVQDWLWYSSDKRTDGGLYLKQDGAKGIVGAIGPTTSQMHFPSVVEACAVYILQELDFWDAVGRRLTRA